MSKVKTAVAEAVLVPETTCRCGGVYMVLQMRGEPAPRALHKKPECKQFQTLQGAAYFEWVRTGVEPAAAPAPAKPNRAQRRRAKHASHAAGRPLDPAVVAALRAAQG
jgi:hypothetical protein